MPVRNPSTHFGLEVRHLAWSAYFWSRMLEGTLSYRYSNTRTPGLRTAVITFPLGTLELLSRQAGVPPETYTGEKNHFSLHEEGLESLHPMMAARMASLKAGRDPLDGSPCGSHGLADYLGRSLLADLRRTGDGFDEFSLTDPEGNTLEFGRPAAPPPSPEIRAVIFDLDGTLLDSEENYYLADRELLARRGVELSREDKARYIGLSTGEMMALLRDRFGISESAEALNKEKNSLYRELLEKHPRIFPNARKVVQDLHSRGFLLGVASGSSAAVVRKALKLTGMDHFFPVAVSSEETGRGKPHPGVFLETARRLGVPPQNCLVFEDAPAGVEAALEAGMYCIAIPAPSLIPGSPPECSGVFSLADLSFPEGGEDWDPEVFWTWMDARSGKKPTSG